jgi:hypothetical protein
MNISPHGRIARLDQAALNTLGGSPGFYARPTVSILVTFWTFLIALYVAVTVSRVFAPDLLRDLVVVLLPALTLLLHVGITYLVYRASDEYQRQRILRCAALAAVILAFAAVADFSLERLGHPHLSMAVVDLSAWSLFVILMLWVLNRPR